MSQETDSASGFSYETAVGVLKKKGMPSMGHLWIQMGSQLKERGAYGYNAQDHISNRQVDFRR